MRPTLWEVSEAIGQLHAHPIQWEVLERIRDDLFTALVSEVSNELQINTNEAETIVLDGDMWSKYDDRAYIYANNETQRLYNKAQDLFEEPFSDN